MSKFCTKCGTQLEDSDKFCYKCGNALGTDPRRESRPVKSVAEPTIKREPVLFAFMGNLKTGALRSKSMIFLITAERLALIKYDQKKMAAFSKQINEEAKAAGLGMLKRMGEALKVSRRFIEMYQQQDIETSLQEDRENFSIYHQYVTGAKLRLGHHSHDEDNNKTPTRLEIRTGSEKYKISTTDLSINKALRNMLREVYGHRLK